MVSFGQPFYTFTPRPFPLNAGIQLVAPYWADADTRAIGTVYFRETNDREILNRAENDIRTFTNNQTNFVPSLVFIATWDGVGYYSNNSDLVGEDMPSIKHPEL